MSAERYHDRCDELTELGSIDEADAYETDLTTVALDAATGKFYILSASGCSCWDGEYTEQQYDSIEDVELSLVGDEVALAADLLAGNPEREFHPSLSGAVELMREVRASLEKLGGQYAN